MRRHWAWYATAAILALVLAALTAIVVTRPTPGPSAGETTRSADGPRTSPASTAPVEIITVPQPKFSWRPWMIKTDDPNWQQDKRWAGHPPPTIVPPIFHNHVKDNWPIPTLTNFIPSKAGFPYTRSLGGSWIYVHKDDQDPTTPRPRTIHVSVDYFHDSYKIKTRNFVNPKAVGNAYCGLRGEFKVETCVLVAQDCIIDFALIGPWEGDVNAQMEQLMLELATELRKQFGTDDQ